jgi:fibronectin type 3 domain-containing protein
VRHNHGRSAGSSNRAVVPPAPVLPPKGLHFELDSRGVYLIWETEEDPEIRSSLVKFDYRIYRREKGSAKRVAVPYLRAVVHTQEGERWSAVDMSIEWEKTYLYSVTPVTRLYSQGGQLISEIEGAGSPPIEITTHDVFPPAVPERVLPIVGHVAGGKFVDLLWAPNTEKDIFGYNVYRREEGGQPARVNSAPITVLSFQDMDVSAGHNYFYCISAVDLRGNESTRSAETTAVAP